MSARDFFVTDEELEARLNEVQPPAPAPSALASDPAALEALLDETTQRFEQQFGNKAIMLPFLLKHMLPALIIGIAVAFSLATSDSDSARESTSIPSPCRG